MAAAKEEPTTALYLVEWRNRQQRGEGRHDGSGSRAEEKLTTAFLCFGRRLRHGGRSTTAAWQRRSSSQRHLYFMGEGTGTGRGRVDDGSVAKEQLIAAFVPCGRRNRHQEGGGDRGCLPRLFQQRTTPQKINIVDHVSISWKTEYASLSFFTKQQKMLGLFFLVLHHYDR